MKKIFSAVLFSLFALNLAYAQTPAPAAPAAPAAVAAPAPNDCEAKAVGKNGKPLAGAAKTAFMKKCQGESGNTATASGCEAKAVGKNGKPLAGAAKTAFMKKCEADAAK